MNKIVSIIITTYKGSSKLKRALNSVLLQTYPSIEIIIVDDNDPESHERIRTKNIINQYAQHHKLTYICHEKHKNGSAARNTGLSHASGYYVSFLDDDDFYLPQKIEHCVEALENAEDCQGVLCQVVKCNKKGLYTRYSTYCDAEKVDLQKSLLMNNNFLGSGSNLFFTLQSVIELHGFDESFIRYQDVEFMLRFFRRYEVVFLHELQVVKAVNGTSNIPPLNSYFQTLNHLVHEFTIDIDRLSEYEKSIFYYKHYEEILRMCKYKGELSIIEQIFEILKNCNLQMHSKYMSLIFSKVTIGSVSFYDIINGLVDNLINRHTNRTICKKIISHKQHSYIQNFLQNGDK